MKAFYSILAGALGGILISGCTTSVGRASIAASPHFAGAHVENRIDDTSLEPAQVIVAKGNPEAYARYAAGVSYEKNNEEGRAIREFNAAALSDPANEELVIEVARHYLRDKETGKALALLTKSAKRRAASAGVFSWLARAQIQAGHTNQALAASKEAIQREPANLDGYQSQVEVYFHSGQFSEAFKTLNRAARDVRPEPATLAALAELYAIYVKSQPKDTEGKARAIAVLDRAVAENLTSDDLSQRLADMYIRLDQPEKASEIYKRILAQYPAGSTMADSLHEKLAGIYFQSSDKTNAMKQLEAIVHDNPTRYPRAWFFLGELAYEDNKLIEAIDDFEAALHWDPSIEQAYYDLALAQLYLHRTDEAFKTLDTARARFSKTFECEFYTGVIFSKVKNYSDAIRHFKEAEIIGLATAPSLLDQRFYFQFGAACERGRQYKPAEEYLQKCIDLKPNFAEALNYLGFMFADLGQQLPRARGLIEKAVRLEPKNGAYLDSLGWVLFKQDQPQQALPWLLKAQQYSPEPDPTVLDHIGDVYLALHQTGKALAAWKESLSLESNEEIKQKVLLNSGGT